jgi:hypothetical protein
MPCVKIKQLDERVATDGLHMGGGDNRRKLQPGEVVDIEEDFEMGVHAPDKSLLDVLWETNKLEMTLDKATRPIDFLNYREGQLTSPTFKSRGADEDLQVEQAWAAVHARMAKQSKAPTQVGSPADDEQPELDDDNAEIVAAELPPPTPLNRRAERRAALQAANRGEALTT